MRPKKTQFRSTSRICVYCGGEATTRDHVIPEGMFTILAPQMITVPACEPCNQKKKEYDTFFREYFVSDERTRHHPVAQELFHGKFHRSLEGGQSIIRGELDKIGAFNPTVIEQMEIDGTLIEVPLNEDRVDEWLSYVVRGMTAYHFKKKNLISDPSSVVTVRPLSSDDARRAWEVLNQKTVHGPFILGDSIFQWAFQFKDVNHSLWLVTFYAGIHYFISLLPAGQE